MTRLFILPAVLFGMALTAADARDVQVKSYTKKDATKVEGYTRHERDRDTVKVEGYTRKDGTKDAGYSRKKSSN